MFHRLKQTQYDKDKLKYFLFFIRLKLMIKNALPAHLYFKFLPKKF
jgi:hypothetical protein